MLHSRLRIFFGSTFVLLTLLVGLSYAESIGSIRPTPLKTNSIRGVTISDDGGVLAWITDDNLYSSSSKDPSEFSAETLRPREGREIRLSGDGKLAVWRTQHATELWRGKIENGKIIDKKRIRESDVPHRFIVNSSGTKVAGIITVRTCAPNGGCSGWHKLGIMDLATNKTICTVKPDTLVNGTAFDDSGAMFYYPGLASGKTGSDILAIRKTSETSWRQEPLGFRHFRLADQAISRDGKVMLLSRRRDPTQKESPFTLYVSYSSTSGWGQPKPVLAEHKESILWNACISPDGTKIAWTHLHRGPDGNETIKKSLMLVELKNGKASKPIVLCEIPENLQVSSFALSNRNILFSTYKKGLPSYKDRNKLQGRLFFFDGLNKTGQLREIRGK